MKESMGILLAALTALIGIIAVAAAFFRKKGKRLKDDLDFDDSIYFDDDEDDQDALYGDEYAQNAGDEADHFDVPEFDGDGQEDPVEE